MKKTDLENWKGKKYLLKLIETSVTCTCTISLKGPYNLYKWISPRLSYSAAPSTELWWLYTDYLSSPFFAVCAYLALISL